MFAALKATLESKKFVVAMLSAIAAGALHFGWHLDPTAIAVILSPLFVAIGAQGWADGDIATAAASVKVAQIHANMYPTSSEFPKSNEAGFTKLGALGVMSMVAALGIALAVIVSCATVKKDAALGASSFATCEKNSLGSIVASTGKTLLAEVAAVIASDGATLETDLDNLAISFGVGGMQCAVAAVDAVVSARPSAPVASTAQELPINGVERADAWSRKWSTAVAK